MTHAEHIRAELVATLEPLIARWLTLRKQNTPHPDVSCLVNTMQAEPRKKFGLFRYHTVYRDTTIELGGWSLDVEPTTYVLEDGTLYLETTFSRRKRFTRVGLSNPEIPLSALKGLPTLLEEKILEEEKRSRR